MAEVIFMSGVTDPLGLATRLLRKKLREGVRTALYAPASLLQQLDALLWQEPALDFLPHVWLRPGAELPAALRERTRLWLLQQPVAGLDCTQAVNLGCDGLDLATRHERVAELIGTSDAARAAGRARWRDYEAAGHQMVHHPQA